MGEGISAGTETGYCVAQAIAKHFDNVKLVYSAYQKSTDALHNDMRRCETLLLEWQAHSKK